MAIYRTVSAYNQARVARMVRLRKAGMLPADIASHMAEDVAYVRRNLAAKGADYSDATCKDREHAAFRKVRRQAAILGAW